MRATWVAVQLASLAWAAGQNGSDGVQTHRIASGWELLETPGYRAAVDQKVAHSGRASLLLASVAENPKAAAVRQMIRANDYRGKRIRFSGWLKARDLTGGAALWFRVDMESGDYVLDGMLPLNPTSDAAPGANGWVKYDTIADVPADAIGISFGVRLDGHGEIWADDLSITDVGARVATTTIERRHLPAAGKDEALARLRRQYSNAPLHPVNLGFETR